jgi:hypothetical protein
MKMLQPALLLALFTQPGLSEELPVIPGPVLLAWENRWQESTEAVVGEFVGGIRDNLSDVDAGRRSELLADIERLFLEAVSWDSLGRDTVARILRSNCGLELLAEVAPYYEGDAVFEDMPEELKRPYLSCFADVDLYVGTSPVYRIYEVAAEQLDSLFRRHGIDPRTLNGL